MIFFNGQHKIEKTWGTSFQRSIQTIFLLLKKRWFPWKILFKGKTRCITEICARGKKYTGIHSIKKYPKTFAPLQTGMWWRNLFTHFAKTQWLFPHYEARGWQVRHLPPPRIFGLFYTFVSLWVSEPQDLTYLPQNHSCVPSFKDNF